MLNPLITTVREGLRYKGKAQHWMWIAHRVSGLGVLLFLILHVFGMSNAYFNPALHEVMLETYKTPLFSIGELALAACLIFHAVNGTRIALLELKPEWWDKQELALKWSLIITALLGAPTILIMAAKSLSHFMSVGVK